MDKLLHTEKYLFSFAMAGFATIQFVTRSLPGEFIPLPVTMPGKTLLALLSGIILLACAVCIIFNKLTKWAALTIGILFLLFLLYPHIPKLVSNLYDPSEWVALLETLCFSCGGFILASVSPTTYSSKWNRPINKAAWTCNYLFATAIFIFGIQHILYEKFIITLIPSWVPFKLAWSYIVKAAFILTALSIVLKTETRLALKLLGIMFLLWVLLLHGPRVIGAPKVEPEWTSFFVAMAMSGICFMMSSLYKKEVDKFDERAFGISEKLKA